MGSSSSPLEFAGKMLHAGNAMEKATKAGTESGALLMKRMILADTPSVLRNAGKRGSKLGVRYNLGDYPDGAKALVYATGPFQLWERDTRPHAIPALLGSRSKAKRPLFGPAFGGLNEKKLVTPYGVKTVIWHPGTKGHHSFEHGVVAAPPLLPKAYDLAVVEHLRAIF